MFGYTNNIDISIENQYCFFVYKIIYKYVLQVMIIYSYCYKDIKYHRKNPNYKIIL